MNSCPICASPSEHLSSLLIRGQYPGEFRRCTFCKFIFASDPLWLNDSFTDELNDLDIGAVDRCLLVADFVTPLISSMGKGLRVLDWGGGYGLLTRLLRDRGVDCLTFDPFVKPILAKGSVAHRLSDFDVVVVSEVMLHLTDPLRVFRELLGMGNVVIFTGVVPPGVVSRDWWYLMPDTGQHVSIFSTQSILAVGKRLDCAVFSDGKFFHVLSNRKLKLKSRILIRHSGFTILCSWVLSGIRYAGRAFGRSPSQLRDDQVRAIANLPWNNKPKDSN